MLLFTLVELGHILNIDAQFDGLHNTLWHYYSFESVFIYLLMSYIALLMTSKQCKLQLANDSDKCFNVVTSAGKPQNMPW